MPPPFVDDDIDWDVEEYDNRSVGDRVDGGERLPAEGGQDLVMMDQLARERNKQVWGDLTVEQSKYLDTIDSLRDIGLGSISSLPQLVVCGDQSAGKSSVLEAISGIPFGAKQNLGTRFTTEIILRRGATESVTARIVPHKSRPDAERIALESFKPQQVNLDLLPNIFEEAARRMGLDDEKPNSKGVVRDILRIEVSGPTKPHLTLVDLSGLIHAGVGQQRPEDVELIRSLVRHYMKEPRSIMQLCKLQATSSAASF